MGRVERLERVEEEFFVQKLDELMEAAIDRALAEVPRGP